MNLNDKRIWEIVKNKCEKYRLLCNKAASDCPNAKAIDILIPSFIENGVNAIKEIADLMIQEGEDEKYVNNAIKKPTAQLEKDTTEYHCGKLGELASNKICPRCSVIYIGNIHRCVE